MVQEPESELVRAFARELDAELAGLPEGLDALRASERLRTRTGSAALARWGTSLYLLRPKAARKFPLDPPRWLTAKGLEQATPEAVARRRAALVRELEPNASILDATCGIGADSLALARSGALVVSADRDPVHAACARANLRDRGLPERVIVADALRPAARTDLLLVDPDRREDDGRRSRDPARHSPGLGEAFALAARARGACLKLGPGMHESELAPLAEALRPRLRLEWVSVAGELRELCAWTGSLSHGRAARSAAVLGRDEVWRELEDDGEEAEAPPLERAEALGARWLLEPDAALVRSGLIGTLARRCGARPVGPRIAYLGLTAEALGPEARAATAFGPAWRVLDSGEADPKRVRAMLRAHDVGEVTVKKRGHPDSAETLARRFRGKGRLRGWLAIARLASGHAAWLLEPPESSASAEGAGPARRSEREGVGDEGFEPPTSSL